MDLRTPPHRRENGVSTRFATNDDNTGSLDHTLTLAAPSGEDARKTNGVAAEVKVACMRACARGKGDDDNSGGGTADPPGA